jgi:hypothetical protein
MAVAFIKLHNRLVDRLRGDETAEEALFEQARRAATWHYQHVILPLALASTSNRSTTDTARASGRCAARSATAGSDSLSGAASPHDARPPAAIRCAPPGPCKFLT